MFDQQYNWYTLPHYIPPGHGLFCCCRYDLTPEEQRHRRTGKTPEQRKDIIMACSQAMHKGVVNFKQAVLKLKLIGGGKTYSAIAGHWTQIMENTWKKWNRTLSLEDAPRSGRPHKVPEAAAKEAAELITQGIWYSVVKHGREFREKRGYTTIRDACRQLQRLQDIKQQYGVDDAGLLRAMQAAVPGLTRRTLFFKRKFTADELATRLSLATWLLQTMPAGEAERKAWLDRMVWIDEGGVALTDYKKKSVKVWCMKHDVNIHSLVHAPWMKGQKECKVHFIIAVTSHPAFAGTNGVVHWDFTTGTTDIRRRKNTMGQEGGEGFGYQVSHSAGVNTMLPQASV
jgi:transposase-like protein